MEYIVSVIQEVIVLFAAACLEEFLSKATYVFTDPGGSDYVKIGESVQNLPIVLDMNGPNDLKSNSRKSWEETMDNAPKCVYVVLGCTIGPVHAWDRRHP
mmetsp:Transcript_13382/g.21874  ORF Transcript_13382/g.21874 Transcript_13382/m.21874 type:complete len:100 (-) Transcript_13382:1049-1348(-)